MLKLRKEKGLPPAGDSPERPMQPVRLGTQRLFFDAAQPPRYALRTASLAISSAPVPESVMRPVSST